MSTKQGMKRWTAEVARRELEGWKRSGLSLSRYAARRGYQMQRLSWWKQRLDDRATAAAPVALAPAVLTGAEVHSVAVVLSPDGALRVEVTDVEGVHPEWVSQLVCSLRRGQ